MSGGTDNRGSSKPTPRRGPAQGSRPPLPGRRPPDGPRPPNFIEQARQRPGGSNARRPAPSPGQTPVARRPTPGVPTSTRANRNPASAIQAGSATATAARKQPTTIEELIPFIIRYCVKRDEGMGLREFDEKIMPRVHTLVPESLGHMQTEVIQSYLVDIAHALYVAILVGQFAERPVLCGVRAAELAADLVERVLQQVNNLPDKRMTVIRCSNLLAGLALHAVRFLESTSLASQPLRGFTDGYERAVVTTFGLKTQAEETGAAPWTGGEGPALDGRISHAINMMSSVFGDYIGQFGESLDEGQYEEVIREFDGFMDRFAPYIEGGRGSADERRKKLVKQTATIMRQQPKVEPLEVKEVRARPAGVEVVLADGRVLFVAREDSRRIGQAADAEVEDTDKRERAAMQARSKTGAKP